MRLTIRERLTCPHCWKGFSPDSALWVAEHESLLDDPRLGADHHLRFLPSRFNSDGDAIDPKGEVCHELACPSCHLVVPRVLFETRPLFVSIVGSPACGKSYFLASMTFRLRSIMPRAFSVTFADADPESNRILCHYEEIQFYNPDRDSIIKLAKTEEQGDLYNTVRDGEQLINYPRPCIFSIRPQADHPSAAKARSVARVLCLYDNAGESFEPGKDTAANPVTRHLAKAQTLFFLYDPTQDPRFREACRGKSSDPQLTSAVVTSRQETVLHEMASRIRRHAQVGQHDKHQRPMIVVVTKFDAWSSLLPHVRLDPPLVRSGKSDWCGVDFPKIQEVSKQVRELLWRYTPELVSTAEGFAREVLFVPVSATGGSPEVDPVTGQMGIRPRNIKPIWAEVPMLITLSRWCGGLVPFYRGGQGDTAPSDHGEAPKAVYTYLPKP